MRIHAAVLALGVTATGAAEASSLLIVAPPPQKLSASLITVGVPPTAPAVGNADILLSPSMIAKGEPAVADDNVASIDEDQPEASMAATPAPMVIRGGTVGDGLVTAQPANNGQAEASPPQQEAAQNAEPQSASQPAEAAQPKGPVQQPE